MPLLKQPSFSKGEISPALYGRTDLAMYQSALQTCLNFLVQQNGGVASRPGTILLAPTKTPNYAPRLIPFEFKTTDKYVLEFGDQYMRVIRDDGHVTANSMAISAITAANPPVVTSAAHGFSNGDEIFITGVLGMLEVDNVRFLVANKTANTFELFKQNGAGAVDGTAFTAYTSGGTASTIYEITTPYGIDDIMDVRFVQSADTMTLVHKSYPVYELTRTGHAAWTLAASTFSPDTSYPADVDVSSQGSTGSFRARYKVTAIGVDESLPGLDTDRAATITAITKANPASVTAVAHGFATDDEVQIAAVVGMTELNGRRFLINKVDANTFTLRDLNSTDYTAYASGGTATPTFVELQLNNITAATQANPCVLTVNAGHGVVANDLIQIAGVVGMTELNNKNWIASAVTGTSITLSSVNSTGFTAYASGGAVWKQNTSYVNVSWDAVAGASSYRVYKEKNGLYGFVGETQALQFNENNIAPDMLDGPPSSRNPFFGAGNYPGAVSFYEQRRVFGGSTNNPDTSDYSVPASSNNFSTSRPSQDDDAISASLPSLQVNEIRHFSPLNDLIVFTSGGEWKVNSGPDSAFTPTTIKQKEQTKYGCNSLRPLVAGSNVVFCEDSGALVRSVGYSYQSDQYISGDLSVLSPHLLAGHTLVDWAWSGSPDNRVYAIRDDGTALSLTYDEAQSIVGWSRLELANKAMFERVATLRKGTGEYHDGTYFVINLGTASDPGRWIVRLADPLVSGDPRDAQYLDAMVTYDIPLDIESVSVADPVVLTITGHGLSNGDEVDVFDLVWEPDTDDLGNESQPAQLNGGRYTVANSTANTFELSGTLGAAYNDWLRGGTVRKVVQTLYGLQHLYGKTVVALCDGGVRRDLSVDSSGRVDLGDSSNASRIHIGIGYNADFQTLSMDKGDGLAGLKKKVNKLAVQVADSRGLWFGPDSEHLDELKQRTDEAYGEPTRLYSATYTVPVPPTWVQGGQIFLRQRDPLPLNITSVTPDTNLGGTAVDA
jgi:hypothetical protein